MKAPICSICLKTEDLLCTGDKQKLERGEINEYDIRVSRFLAKLEEKYPILKNLNLIKVFVIDDFLILKVGKEQIPLVIGPKGQIIKQLEQKFNKKIRVIEKDASIEKTIKDILYPIEVLGINTIWLPDGSSERKIMVSDRYKTKIKDVKKLEAIIKKSIKENIRIEFE